MVEDSWGLIAPQRRDNIDQVFSAFKSVRTSFSYVSMPVTGGARLYDFLESKGVRSKDELPSSEKNEMYTRVIAPNIEEGVAKADSLRLLSKFAPLAPGVFEAMKQRWTQSEYMLLWFHVIDELAGEMFMTSNWGFTLGGAKEFTRAKLLENGLINNAHSFAPELFPNIQYSAEHVGEMRKMRSYDENGSRIPLDFGMRVIANAAFDIHTRGFEVSAEYGEVARTLYRILETLREGYTGITPDWTDIAPHMIHDSTLDDCMQSDGKNMIADMEAIDTLVKSKELRSFIDASPRPSFWMRGSKEHGFTSREIRLPLPKYSLEAQRTLETQLPARVAQVTGELVL